MILGLVFVLLGLGACAIGRMPGEDNVACFMDILKMSINQNYVETLHKVSDSGDKCV